MSLCENCKSLDLCTAVENNKEACFFFSPTEKYRIENSKEYAIGYEQGRAKVLEEVMAIIKAKISEKEYPIETMVELTDLGGKIQQLNNVK